jgi:hypothetical protein
MPDLTKSRDRMVSGINPADTFRQSAAKRTRKDELELPSTNIFNRHPSRAIRRGIALAIIVSIFTFAWFAMDRDARVVRASETKSSPATSISIRRNLESNGRRKPETSVKADIRPAILSFLPTLLQPVQIADLNIAATNSFALRTKIDRVMNDNLMAADHQKINYRGRPRP